MDTDKRPLFQAGMDMFQQQIFGLHAKFEAAKTDVSNARDNYSIAKANDDAPYDNDNYMDRDSKEAPGALRALGVAEENLERLTRELNSALTDYESISPSWAAQMREQFKLVK